MDGGPPPPPPPPHGSNPQSSSSNLPPGNYDIFIIPPHSAGGGFIYLPSLRVQTNSFFAGVACTLIVVIAFHAVQPTLKEWSNSVSQSGGGAGVFILVLAVGILGWIWGKTTLDGPTSGQTPGANPSGAGGAGPGNTNHGQQHHGPPPNGFPNGAASPGSEKAQWGPNSGAHGYSQRQYHSSPPPTEPGTTGFDSNTRSPPNTNASSSWQKAREETRKREEERRRAEELKKKQEEERKTKEAAEAQARASAEKERWEKLRAREKEAREREARERLARERMAKEKAEREAKEKSQRDKLDQEARLKAARERAEKLARERAESAKAESQKAQSERATPTYGVGERTNPYSLDDSPAGPKSTIGVSSTPKPTSPGKPYQHPTAQSYAGTATETAFRPYDTPPRPKPAKSQSSFYSTYSPSYAPSESTARTSPPPSHATGPYFTSDPEKVVIRGAFKFTDLFPKPVAAVKPGEDGITDGLIMRVSTEGVFLDDDKKKEALRQWDIKAWTMKGIETINKAGFHIVRATIRDPENTKYVYFVPDSQAYKVPSVLKHLKEGSLLQPRFTFTSMSNSEATKVMEKIGHL